MGVDSIDTEHNGSSRRVYEELGKKEYERERREPVKRLTAKRQEENKERRQNFESGRKPKREEQSQSKQ